MRARSLKPGYFKNERLAALPPFARLLFAGLWGLADREGRLRDNSRLIGAEIFPYEKHNVEKLLRVLAEVEEPNGGGPAFILRYEVNSSRYIQIVNFISHQNPHVKEPPSVIPAQGKSGAAPGAGPGAEHQKKPVLSRADSGLPISDSGLRTPDSRTAAGRGEDFSRVHRERERDPFGPDAPPEARAAAEKRRAGDAWFDSGGTSRKPEPWLTALSYGPDSRNDERERLLLWESGDDEAFTRHVAPREESSLAEAGPTP
jgi:hypothetical protein